MLLKISQRLRLASLGDRHFGAEETQTVSGLEVTEYTEYRNPALIADARELLASDYARTATVVFETRGGAR